MRLPRLKTWYAVMLGLWAVVIAPACVLGFLYAGANISFLKYHLDDPLALLLDLLFVLPVLLLPVGFRRRVSD